MSDRMIFIRASFPETTLDVVPHLAKYVWARHPSLSWDVMNGAVRGSWFNQRTNEIVRLPSMSLLIFLVVEKTLSSDGTRRRQELVRVEEKLSVCEKKRGQGSSLFRGHWCSSRAPPRCIIRM